MMTTLLIGWLMAPGPTVCDAADRVWKVIEWPLFHFEQDCMRISDWLLRPIPGGNPNQRLRELIEKP